MTGWRPTFAGFTRRQCPLCDWYMDEPPMETMSEVVGDQIVMRVRQQSAVPAGLMHIVTEHPGSDEAAEIMATAEATRA